MDNEWMVYVCGEHCCSSRNKSLKKDTFNLIGGALGYYRDEIDSVLTQAKDKLSSTFVNVYDRVIDILAMSQQPDVTVFQIQQYYREIIDLLQDPDKQTQYVQSVEEDITTAQDAAIAATLTFYPSVIIANMGKKPARVMKPTIRTPGKDEFVTGISFGGTAIANIISDTTTDVFTRITTKFREYINNPDLTREDFIDSVNEAIDTIDSYAENISTTEVEATTRRVVKRINALNQPLVKSYRRVAVIDNKTCVGCLALHGKLYALADEFESHPRCRCMLVPVTMTWMEYASVQGGAVPNYMSLDQILGMMPRAILADILGPGRLALYDAGLPLERMIYIEQTAEYGHLIRITPLSVLREQGIP